MSTQDLLKLNVNEHVEKKNGLSYLSWAWAWAEALKADADATFRVETFTGAAGVSQCWMDVGSTAMVWVTVTLFGKPRTCSLPVMDNRNKAITSPDAFAINTSIVRCLTKCLALHGLGLYIYAGEDLPEDADGNVASKQPVAKSSAHAAELKAIKTVPELNALFKSLPEDVRLERTADFKARKAELVAA